MPFTVTKTTTRPAGDVPVFKDSADLDPEVAASIANVSHAVRTHPAVQSRSVVMSADGLTKTTTTVWESQEAYDSFQAANSADLSKLSSAASSYNKANGIVVNTTKTGA
jgi:cytochrome c556